MTIRARVGGAIAAAAAAAVLAGCGSTAPTSEADRVADAIHDFNVAFSRGDGERTCELITDQYREAIEGGRGSCQRAVAEEAGASGAEHDQVRALGTARVTNVLFAGDVATADVEGPGLESGPPAQAQRQDGLWLVSATAWGLL